MREKILIVDDEVDLLRGLSRMLPYEIECEVLTAEEGQQALELLKKEQIDLMLLDIRMPGTGGIEVLEKALRIDPLLTVVMMTAYGTIEVAVESIKKGAYDFIKKPFTDTELVHAIKKALERNRLIRENLNLYQRIQEGGALEGLVGSSPKLMRVYETIRMVAPTDLTVLIMGESGTGKDLAAKAIHALSHRKHHPMVTVNCPTLPENILESELFGYRKGAFTDAREDKKGLFQAAHRGTIFLDEIGDIPPSIQTKLLRVLQEKEIKPLGDNHTIKVDVRIVASTNQDLQEKISKGLFREDLYYRLNVVTIKMPPLREIREDIPVLVHHFLEMSAKELSIPIKRISKEAMNYLLKQEWKGNVRELQNTIKRACALTSSNVIQIRDLLPMDEGLDSFVSNPEVWTMEPYKVAKARCLEEFTRRYITGMLRATSGNVSEAARRSGIERQSFQKIMRRYGIRSERFKGKVKDA